VAQTPEQKKAWVQANPRDMWGLTPPQYRLLWAMYELRLRGGTQAWHGTARIRAAWREHGGSTHVPLWTMLYTLRARGYIEKSEMFDGAWRLHHLPHHVAAARDAASSLRVLAQPRRVRAVA
jgi:hypothetical protein